MSKDNGRRFAVSSRTGVHIGLWSNGKIAAEVAAENPGNTIEEYLRADHVDALLKAEREKALREAAEKVADLYGEYSEGVPYCDRDEAFAVIEALISEDKTDE